MGVMPGGMLLPSQGFQLSQGVMQMEREAQQMAQMLGGMQDAQRT